jgi:hypothetical protein
VRHDAPQAAPTEALARSRPNLYVVPMLGSHGVSSAEVRALLRLGLSLCACALLASVWDVLTLQVPSSPFHVGVLSGPVEQLSRFSAGLGLGALTLALAWPSLYPPGEGALAARAYLIGSLLHVAALAYAASQGLLGVQVLDVRLDARLVVYARGLSHVLLLGALGSACYRAFRLRSQE